MSAAYPSAREFAAVTFALAAARGALSTVLMGKYDHEDIARLLAATSTANIAAVIGSTANDLAVDWNDYLSTAEQRAIKGADRA